MRILLIEDDAEATANVVRGLEADDHEIGCAADGRDGLNRAITERWDVMIIDRMLPGVDGVALLQAARAVGVQTPALFLTTLSGIDDRVEGLKAGGDDYLTKPFSFAELAARLEALVRRPPLLTTRMNFGGLEINRLTRKVRQNGTEVDLQPREYQLLEFLAINAGKVMTRKMLLEKVWDFHFDPKTNVVESHISRLRTKLGEAGCEDLINTVRNAGYRFGPTAPS